MVRQHVEVAVVVQDNGTGTHGDRADETVNRPANGVALPSAQTILAGPRPHDRPARSVD